MPGLRLPSGRTVDVHDGFIIGVDAGCDLRLVDPQAMARHLIIQRVGEDTWQAATLSLSAATKINGAPMAGLARLKDGDVVTVGGTDLHWQAAVGVAAAQQSGWSDVLLALIVMAVLSFAVWQQGRWRQQPFITPMPPTAPAPTVCAPALATPCRPPVYRLMIPAPSTSTPTSTPAPPPSPSPTVTPIPGPTLTATATLSPTPISPSTSTPTSVPLRSCPIPDGWVKKVVRQDETLQGLARRYGIRVARLRQANCLQNNQIKWGQILYVPRRP